MVSNQKHLGDLVEMEKPEQVLREVRLIFSDMFADEIFSPVDRTFRDVYSLFQGQYIGYHGCSTYYHNFRHTTDCLLAMIRLIHGAFLTGISLEEREVILGLIATLLHDTGYITIEGEGEKSGAIYTMVHVQRSIDFTEKYFQQIGFSEQDYLFCRSSIQCTGYLFGMKPTSFISEHHRVISQMLGTADLLGQMADRTYLEKLLFLYHEFIEAGIGRYSNEVDLLKKTQAFYGDAQRKFDNELGGVNKYMIEHFQKRWQISTDLYRESIENQLDYLDKILSQTTKEPFQHFRREK